MHVHGFGGRVVLERVRTRFWGVSALLTRLNARLCGLVEGAC